jgi:hypothetical protein
VQRLLSVAVSRVPTVTEFRVIFFHARRSLPTGLTG